MCMTVFSLSYLGKTAVRSHMNSKKHQRAISAFSECPLLKCLQRSQLVDIIKPSTSTADETVRSLPEMAIEMCGVAKFVLNDNMTAEIFWCALTVMSHKCNWICNADKNTSFFF
ncbi:hypothetical protein PR048_006337 [Dryococelus australis]|uniref:Uncharacterized protein n=1 Tax=Dryococelus australis TaxID=614101 RepID=A0ABQ9IBD1_9NEOP|nr:hypothetical protein PR048_006337 [Dryococelus australis]